MRLDTEFIEDHPIGPLDFYRKRAKFDWKLLKVFIEDEEALKIKTEMWKILENDQLFERSKNELTVNEQKRMTGLRLNKYLQYDFLRNARNLSYKQRTRLMMIYNEALAIIFPDVSIKYALGVSLFKNLLTSLGTERHTQILDAVWQNRIIASFALTEIAHGSDTKSMRTIATYDAKTKEYIMHTPDFLAAKCWPGNLGHCCTLAIVFAQLYTPDGTCHGLHAFLVPIRNPLTLDAYPGCTVGDIGEKAGLNGIDNGFLSFNHYRIPREMLLNRLGDVSVDGVYECHLTDEGRSGMLGALLDCLSTGRIGVMQEASNCLINAVVIAVRYAAIRKQFTYDNEEVPLLEYQLHQYRLFPYVAHALILRIFINAFSDDFLNAVENSTNNLDLENLTATTSEIHAIVSTCKPLLTWTARNAVQECRECCGGFGFLRHARFDQLHRCSDASTTYEGDNHVLLRQTSRWLLRRYQQNDRSTPLGSCNFLSRRHQIESSYRYDKNDISNFDFIKICYEWLMLYLCKETLKKRESYQDIDKAIDDTQVFFASTLSRVYGEYVAFIYFIDKWQKVMDKTIHDVLKDFGLLYGFFNLNKYTSYFYEGGFVDVNDGSFTNFFKTNILELCLKCKDQVLSVCDAMAPPDYVLNSVLARTDGKLYENVKELFFIGHPSKLEWLNEIILPNGIDLTKIQSKL